MNQKSPNSADFIVQNGLDHNSWRFSSFEDAYVDRAGVSATTVTGKVILTWLKAIKKR